MDTNLFKIFFCLKTLRMMDNNNNLFYIILLKYLNNLHIRTYETIFLQVMVN